MTRTLRWYRSRRGPCFLRGFGQQRIIVYKTLDGGFSYGVDGQKASRTFPTEDDAFTACEITLGIRQEGTA